MQAIWPQLTYLALSLIGIGIVMALHGQPKSGSYNFWTSLVSASVSLWILYEGGFFNVLLK